MKRDTSQTPRIPSYIVVTDAAPLKEGGHGCAVLAHRLIGFFPDKVKLVITHRFGKRSSQPVVRAGLDVPFLFYPQIPAVPGPEWVQALRGVLNVLFFGLWLAARGWGIKRRGYGRLLALFGGNGWFLFQVFLLQRWLGIPTDAYLVDDLEESARLGGCAGTASIFRWVEPVFLRGVDRVFAISPGYCQHLKEKYGVLAEYLPIPVKADALEPMPFVPRNPDVRSIVFLGAVNHLYIPALQDLLGVISEWNRTHSSTFRLRLSLLTYSSADHIRRALGHHPDLDIERGVTTPDRIERLRNCWAIFVPYSFDKKVRVMVATSFPSKLAEAYAGGRPILAYGPREASLPRYFLDHGLPLCATTKEELKETVKALSARDCPELIDRYKALILKLHSPGALQARLAV